MKTNVIAILLSVFAGAALAAPTGEAASSMMTDRQMKAVDILHQNKAKLGLSSEEMQLFDNFMVGLNKRDVSEGISASISTGTIDELLQELGGTTEKLTKALDVLKSKKGKRDEDAVDVSEALEASMKKMDPTKALTDLLGKLQKAKKPKRDEDAIDMTEALDAGMKKPLSGVTKPVGDIVGKLGKSKKPKRDEDAVDMTEDLDADMKKPLSGATKPVGDIVGKLEKAKMEKREEDAVDISESLDADLKKMDPTKALMDILGMLQKEMKGKREVEAVDASKKDDPTKALTGALGKGKKTGLLGGSLIPGLL